MKASDSVLRRLLKSAASVPPAQPDAPPFALEMCVLASWRTPRFEGEWDGQLRFLRVGLGFAAVLTVAIIALSLRGIPKEPPDEFAVPKAVLNLALLQ